MSLVTVIPEQEPSNDFVYHELLRKILNHKSEANSEIAYELLDASADFNPYETLSCVNEKYAKNELSWYESCDLSINGHEGIENNPVWKRCATKDGMINSNYGWCVWSKENNEQYKHVLESFKKDISNKHGVMLYSRPTINDEWNDDVHAHYDMMCTIYVSYMLREGLMHCFVHMRSNDAWSGIRNDLVWQQFVLNKLVSELNDCGIECKCGPIHWHADSLHIYKRSEERILNYLKEKGVKV